MALHMLHYSDIENATDEPARVGRLVNCLRTRRDEQTLVCGTGDTVAPGVLAIETGGSHVLPFFEAADPGFSTIGNHDLDQGLDSLRTVIDESPQSWLAANLFDGDAVFGHEQGVQQTAVVSDAGGDDSTQVGLVGVTDPETVGEHVHASGLAVTEPVTAVQEALADALAGCEFVVVLSHAGRRDGEIARLDGVDVVLGGHDHRERAEVVDGTPVVHPGERGDYVSAVEVGAGPPTATLHDVTEYAVAEDVVTRYRALREDNGLTESVARVETPVRRDRDDQYPESPVGNFVVDALRWKAGADVAVCHPGMFRSGPPLTGDVSTGAVRATVPFETAFHTATLDGDALCRLFESMGGPASRPITTEVYGHVGGAALTWRRSPEMVELVEATVGGAPPTAVDRYTVAAPSYEFHADLYPVLTPDRIEETETDLGATLVEYARTHGIPSTTDGRMTTVADTADDEVRSLR